MKHCDKRIAEVITFFLLYAFLLLFSGFDIWICRVRRVAVFCGNDMSGRGNDREMRKIEKACVGYSQILVIFADSY